MFSHDTSGRLRQLPWDNVFATRAQANSLCCDDAWAAGQAAHTCLSFSVKIQANRGVPLRKPYEEDLTFHGGILGAPETTHDYLIMAPIRMQLRVSCQQSKFFVPAAYSIQKGELLSLSALAERYMAQIVVPSFR